MRKIIRGLDLLLEFLTTKAFFVFTIVAFILKWPDLGITNRFLIGTVDVVVAILSNMTVLLALYAYEPAYRIQKRNKGALLLEMRKKTTPTECIINAWKKNRELFWPLTIVVLIFGFVTLVKGALPNYATVVGAMSIWVEHENKNMILDRIGSGSKREK